MKKIVHALTAVLLITALPVCAQEEQKKQERKDIQQEILRLEAISTMLRALIGEITPQFPDVTDLVINCADKFGQKEISGQVKTTSEMRDSIQVVDSNDNKVVGTISIQTKSQSVGAPFSNFFMGLHQPKSPTQLWHLKLRFFDVNDQRLFEVPLRYCRDSK